MSKDDDCPTETSNTDNKRRRIDFFSSNISDTNNIEKYRGLLDSIGSVGPETSEDELNDLHLRVCNFVNPSFDPDENKITFADVAGWDSLKEEMRDRINPPPYNWLHKNRDPSREAEYRMKFNLILFGPPGTGMCCWFPWKLH